jgi:hypothetical protein
MNEPMSDEALQAPIESATISNPPDGEGAVTIDGLFRNRNFVLLAAGELVSTLGDQLSLVAFPWLVLALTHDSVAMATVVACATIPRALFLLLGGIVVDRLSPKRVLSLTRLLDAAVVGTLATTIWLGSPAMWMVYTVATVGGLVAAFSLPAAMSITPSLVSPKQLQVANAFVMGISQFSMLVGPAFAGVVIATSGPTSQYSSSGLDGLALAFSLDAASFVLASLLLQGIAARTTPASARAISLLADFREVVAFLWGDRSLRVLGFYFALAALCVSGPIQVALPFIVDRILHGSAGTLGLLMSSLAIGSLLGMGISAATASGRSWPLGKVLLAFDASAALALIGLGNAAATWQGVALIAAIGALGGFVQTALLAWMQRRIPEAMMGRSTSIFASIIFFVVTIGALISGVALEAFPLNLVLDTVGILLLAIVFFFFLASAIPRIYANQ